MLSQQTWFTVFVGGFKHTKTSCTISTCVCLSLFWVTGVNISTARALVAYTWCDLIKKHVFFSENQNHFRSKVKISGHNNNNYSKFKENLFVWNDTRLGRASFCVHLKIRLTISVCDDTLVISLIYLYNLISLLYVCCRSSHSLVLKYSSPFLSFLFRCLYLFNKFIFVSLYMPRKVNMTCKIVYFRSIMCAIVSLGTPRSFPLNRKIMSGKAELLRLAPFPNQFCPV